MDIEVTDERVNDSQKAKKLVEGAKKEVEEKGKRISRVIADKGYDTHEFFRYLHREGIEYINNHAYDSWEGIYEGGACRS